MSEPRRDCYLAPATGEDTSEALEVAIDALARRRGLDGPADASVRLHLLASLVAEAQSRLATAVAEARAESCSWAQIADLLGVTRASAWQRYAEQRPTHTSGPGR
ncbi:MAG: hypothetical protein ACRETZ_12235 [Steroidobacteraceae bacterium]